MSDRSSCPPPEVLATALGAARGAAAATGGEGAGLPPDLEAHLAECAECRCEAAALALLAEAATAQERALLDGLAVDDLAADWLLRAAAQRAGPLALALASADERRAPAIAERPRRAPRARWARRLAAAGTIAAAASVAFVLRAGPSPEALVASLPARSRPLPGALSALPYAPYQPVRGAAEAGGDGVLAKLLDAKERQAPGAERALAAFYLWRGEAGDAARAELLLRAARPSAEVWSDLAGLALAHADAEAALDHSLAALALQPALGAARFNQGLALAALGLPTEARAAFEAVPASPWAAEARAQAGLLPIAQRDCAPSAPTGSPGERLPALRALFAIRSPGQRDAALAQVAALVMADATLARDLSRLADRVSAWTPAQLAAHGALWDRYAALKAAASAGRAVLGVAHTFTEAASADPLLAVPALGLEAFDLQQRGEALTARALYRRMLARCRAEGCTAESEAIALDELADAAGHDGDFAEAHRLQAAAETLLERRGARVQLAELWGKRAVLLAAEGRLTAAATQARRALSLFSPADAPGASCAPPAVRAQALLVAETVASDRGLTRAAAALDEAGLALLTDQPASPVAVRLARSLAVARSLLGKPAEARALVEKERARQEAAGEKRGALELRAQLARLAEAAGDHAAALTEARRGLVEAAGAEGTFSTTPSIAELRLLVGRALAQQASQGAPEAAPALRAQAEAELSRVVEAAASAADADDAPEGARALALGGPAQEAALELAVLGMQQEHEPESLLLPLERLRAAALHAQPAGERWHSRVPEGACLVALLPHRQGLLRLVVSAGAVEARALPPTAAALGAMVEEARTARPGAQQVTAGEQRLGDALFAGLPAACAEAKQVALFAEAPLDRVDLTALPLSREQGGRHGEQRGERLGLRTAALSVSSLGRWLAPKQGALPGALLVHGAVTPEGTLSPALPATAQERQTLRAAFSPLEELTGPAATPGALLARLPALGLLHAAVHGAAGARAGGGHLLLSAAIGEEPRLPVEQIARAHLSPGTRVVLAACHAASAESGLGLAFLRAGAAVVVAAQGEVDDAAAARWAALFYPALARGLSPAEANREALRGQTGSGARAWFTVLE